MKLPYYSLGILNLDRVTLVRFTFKLASKIGLGFLNADPCKSVGEDSPQIWLVSIVVQPCRPNCGTLQNKSAAAYSLFCSSPPSLLQKHSGTLAAES